MSLIKRLSEKLISIIAAGEVIERPANVVKELVENSIDAGASKIIISLDDSGKNLIKIEDNGLGMSLEDMKLAIERHATSKLDDEQLIEIPNFGFRGEALASICAISRFSLCSRKQGSEDGWQLFIEEGDLNSIKIEPFRMDSNGTMIQVSDIFFTIPNRLKFLQSNRSELLYIMNLINSMAVSRPDIEFILYNNGDLKFSYNQCPSSSDYLMRIYKICVSNAYSKNSVENFFCFKDKESLGSDIKLLCVLSIPVLNYYNYSKLYFIVNGRPIKDSRIYQLIRIAYSDFIPQGRYPMGMVKLDLPYHMVDVNIHPRKYEINIRDERLLFSKIRQLIECNISKYNNKSFYIDHINNVPDNKVQQNIKNNLSSNQGNSSIDYHKLHINRSNANLTSSLKNNNISNANLTLNDSLVNDKKKYNFHEEYKQNVSEKSMNIVSDHDINVLKKIDEATKTTKDELLEDDKNSIVTSPMLLQDSELGTALCQVHNMYIIAQNADGIVIVDQHAIHERLLYEDIKCDIKNTSIYSQFIIKPEIVECDYEDQELLRQNRDTLEKYGIRFSNVSDDTILLTEISTLFKDMNLQSLIQDICNDIRQYGTVRSINNKIKDVYGNSACKNAIKAGRKMTIEEMNFLLRQIEESKNSGQCNHGRPTYIKIKLKDINKLFERI